jgi:hypothetical protein
MTLDRRGPKYRISQLLFVTPIFIALSCHRELPPAAPPPPPPPPPPVVEAPPPPKCEKLDEGCIAQGGTKARLDHSDWRIEPPANWTYAQGTMVIASHDGSVLAATVQPAGPAKLNRAKREELFANLIGELKITLPKKKFVWPKKADQMLDAGPLKVSLYQLDVTREGKKGPLLFFSVTPAEGEGMLGAGFVPEDDSTNADQAILAAIRSIDQLVVAPQGANPP